VKTFAHPVDRNAFQLGSLGDRPDGGVEAGAVAAAGDEAESSYFGVFFLSFQNRSAYPNSFPLRLTRAPAIPKRT